MDRYLITGATGYVGSMLARRILSDGQALSVLVRDSTRLDQDILSGAEVLQADIMDREALDRIVRSYDYIIHCAAPTRSAYMLSNPVEVVGAIVTGTENLLKLACRCSVKSMVYLSSMEVYGQIDCSDGRRVQEDELGYIDVSDARSCYPLGKLMAEGLCHFYCAEYHVPVRIARLAQTFGRGIRLEDNRVFAQFASSVRNSSDIILHTAGDSMGNYCSIDDTVEAILVILKKGEVSEAYNVVNEANTMRIRDMAQLVAEKVAKGGIKVRYDIQDRAHLGYAANTGLRLSGEKLRKLGWEATRSLEEMYREMLEEQTNS